MMKNINHKVYYYLYGSENAKYLTLLLYAAAILIAVFCSFILKNEFWNSFLHSLLFFCVGLRCTWSAIGYLLYPQETASLMGWQISHFQIEAGAAHVGLALTGLLSPFYTTWSSPVGCIALFFFAGSLYAHVYAHIKTGGTMFPWANRTLHKGSDPRLYSSVAIFISLLSSLLLR